MLDFHGPGGIRPEECGLLECRPLWNGGLLRMSAQLPASASPSQRELEDLVKLALDEAQRGGASQSEAAIGVGTGLSVTVRLGEVETLEYQRDRELSVTVYFSEGAGGYRKGAASTADLRPDAIREAVQ